MNRIVDYVVEIILILSISRATVFRVTVVIKHLRKVWLRQARVIGEYLTWQFSLDGVLHDFKMNTCMLKFESDDLKVRRIL